MRTTLLKSYNGGLWKNNYRSGPTSQLLLKENLFRYHAFTLFKKSTRTCPDLEGKIGTLVTKKTLAVPATKFL